MYIFRNDSFSKCSKYLLIYEYILIFIVDDLNIQINKTVAVHFYLSLMLPIYSDFLFLVC